ncbi:hypothetical protein HDU97_003220 [Phlyctochytrium planicorne]|nr:hypothetical protein HDU97_003220 [Phlyctochytrium planicorne]
MLAAKRQLSKSSRTFLRNSTFKPTVSGRGSITLLLLCSLLTVQAKFSVFKIQYSEDNAESKEWLQEDTPSDHINDLANELTNSVFARCSNQGCGFGTPRDIGGIYPSIHSASWYGGSSSTPYDFFKTMLYSTLSKTTAAYENFEWGYDEGGAVKGYRHWRVAPQQISIERFDCDTCGESPLADGSKDCNGCNGADHLHVTFSAKPGAKPGCGASFNIARTVIGFIPQFGGYVSGVMGIYCFSIQSLMHEQIPTCVPGGNYTLRVDADGIAVNTPCMPPGWKEFEEAANNATVMMGARR